MAPEHDDHDLLVVLTYYTPYVSGLTNVARDVAEGLAARGWRVCVVTSQHDPSLPTEEWLGGVRIIRAPVLARIGKGTIGLNLTRLALREMRRARVVNLHLPLIEAGVLAPLSPVPVVTTYHCDVSLPPGAFNRFQQNAIDRSSGRAMRHSATVTVSSEDYARHSRLWTRIRPGMVEIPPPCRPAEGGAPVLRDGPGLHVGFLGRVVEEKGIEYLVDAFRAMDDPDARLLIGGGYHGIAGGSVVDRVRRRVGDDPRIRLLGYLPDEELPNFYRSLDVLALPSVNAFEAFGIVQVVGMLAGVPAVVSDLPGVRTAVRRTGFGSVVPPRDVTGLTAALCRVRDAPPDPGAGAAATATEFDFEAAIDAYELVLAKHTDGWAGGRSEPTPNRSRGPNEVAMNIDRVADTWTRLGREDPLWAVLSDREKSGGGWEVRDFLQTGVAEIDRVLGRLDELGAAPHRGTALDFGCGAGRLSHGLATAGFERVIGLDVSEPMLDKARGLVGSDRCEFRRVSGPDLAGVDDGSVDFVYCCRVLQHMPPALAERYVREFHRVLRPGGVLAFQVPDRPAPTPSGTVLRVLPRPVADRLRKGMEMHGTAPARVRAVVEDAGGALVTVDPDDSAGPRWTSWLYVVRAGETTPVRSDDPSAVLPKPPDGGIRRRVAVATGEARIVLGRAGRMVRSDGVLGTARFFGGLVVEQLRFPLLRRRRADARIAFAGTEIPYAYHMFNQTWRNERCLEIAVAKHFLAGSGPWRMLEVGNVLGHYGVDGHRVVDRYENLMGAHNVDVLELDEPGRYDTIVSISSLEHVRFDEDEQDPHGAALALEKLRSTLAPGGRLLVTVPIGYNPGMDADIASGRFALDEQTFYQRVNADGDWLPVAAEQALSCRYGEPYEAANAVLVGVERRAAG